MRRLVESWVAAEKAHYGNNLTEALKGMNATLEMKVAPSRVSEWRRGVYEPSQGAISFMLFRTLPWALGRASIPASPAAYGQLEELLWERIGEEVELL